MLTQDDLKKMLHYNDETGVFTWLVSRGRMAKSGDVAGSTDTNGHRQICVDGKTYQAHRLAWLYSFGKFPGNHIDHINGKRTDNRLLNLRDVTRLENQQNQKKYNTNKSGVTGVSWHKQHQKWYVNVQQNKKVKFLGLFGNLFDAAAAAKSARNRLGFHANHGR